MSECGVNKGEVVWRTLVKYIREEEERKEDGKSKREGKEGEEGRRREVHVEKGWEGECGWVRKVRVNSEGMGTNNLYVVKPVSGIEGREPSLIINIRVTDILQLVQTTRCVYVCVACISCVLHVLYTYTWHQYGYTTYPYTVYIMSTKNSGNACILNVLLMTIVFITML